MSEIDIVARLQLRAEQFSSETGQRFAEMKTRAASTAQQIRADFGGAFAEVQKLATSALQLPRSKSGSLDLSGEISQLRQAEVASENHAQALRELSIAQTAAAGAAGVDARALQLEADASAVGALAAERDAQAIRDRIVALEAVQTQLGRTTSATRLNTGALEQAGVSAGQRRAALQQLGFQVNDVATQLASGTKATIVFAQQSGQFIQALTMMTTKTTGFLGFLAGPWGAALTAATVVAVPFVAKLFEGNDALADAEVKLRKHAAQTDLDRQAQEAFGHTLDGQIDSLRSYNAEMEKTLRTQRQIQLGKAVEGEQGAAQAQATIARYTREIADLRNSVAADRRSADRTTDLNAQISYLASVEDGERKIGELTTKRAAALAEVAKAEFSIRSARAALIEGDVAASFDKQAAAAARYTAQLGVLYNQLRVGPGKKGFMRERQADGSFVRKQIDGIDDAHFKAQLARITQERKAAEKAARDAEAAAGRKPASLGTQIRDDRAASLLSDAKSYSGLREGSSGLAALFSGAGIHIDPEKMAWCAAFVNAVLAGRGIAGTGKGDFAARDFLGYGKEVAKPQPGDIVILKGAAGPGSGHVGFYAGQGAGGSVMVTGGNQGNAVSTAAFKRSDVLGFRRAPTESEAWKDEIRDTHEAEKAARDYMSTLSGLEGRFDPLATAMRQYSTDLAEIARLAALPIGDPAHIDEGTAQKYRDAARALKELAEVKARYASGALQTPDAPKGLEQFSEEGQREAKRVQDEQQQRAERNMRELSDVFYDAFSGRVDDIWKRFRQMALGSIADLAAKNFLNLFTTTGAPKKEPGGGNNDAVGELRKVNSGIDRLGIKLPKDLGKTLLEGAGTGMLAGGAFQSITGGKGSQLGGAIGGALGQFAGKELGKTFASSLGSLGKLAGPLGAIAGGVLGNVIGGLLKKTKTGSATLKIENGGIDVGSTSGNSASFKTAASGLAGTVGDSLTRIADSLGGSLAGAISVSIGKRDKKFVVDTTGSGKTKGAGTQKFDDEEAAVRAAIADALSDGAIQGISDASKRILAAGGSKLESAIEKAALIEAIPKQLKAMLDPVGAALDDLNSQWAKTVAALKEGGASVAQMTEAEQLYRLQLAETKATTAEASASLKDFLKSLSFGSNSPLSLRDQEGSAKDALQPFLDKIAGGERIDQDKYRDAAQAYLDIERQLYGSTDQYFAAFQQIQQATASAIASIDNAVPIREAKPDPFAQVTATNTATANELLAQISNQLKTIASGAGGGGGGFAAAIGFIGSSRNFVNAA